MDVRKILKDFDGIECSVFVNNRLILRLKEDAMMFLGDSEHDKEIRGMCLAEARKIKADFFTKNIPFPAAESGF